MTKVTEQIVTRLIKSFFFFQHDCQLTGCLNGGSCTFIVPSETFSCKCKDPWAGSYCEGKEQDVLKGTSLE